jgi:2-hydroxychromene-2-carboxylate isomerase
MVRSARFLGLPFNLPSPFPVGTVTACRAFYAAPKDKQAPLAKALYRAYFVDGQNIGEAETVLSIAGSLGLKPDLADSSLKEKTKSEVEASIGRGVFGSPYFIVDGEAFWGIDRLDQLDRWLRGPF